MACDMKGFAFSAVLVAMGLVAGVAQADVAPPDVQACWGLSVGAPCSDGVCKNSTCERYDYVSGTMVSYPCVRCMTGPVSLAVPAITLTGLFACAGVVSLIGMRRSRTRQIETMTC